MLRIAVEDKRFATKVRCGDDSHVNGIRDPFSPPKRVSGEVRSSSVIQDGKNTFRLGSIENKALSIFFPDDPTLVKPSQIGIPVN
jgi:hypothetical protein